MKTNELIKGLNEQQQDAVLSVEGAIQVNSVAGSGKTRVLVNRIAHMINTGIKPGNILCATFTKKASDEMISRLSTIIPKMTLMQLTIGTTHSIGYRILSKEYSESNHKLASAFRKPGGVMIGYHQKNFISKIKTEMMKDRTVPGAVKEEVEKLTVPEIMRVISLSKTDDIDQYQYESMNTGRDTKYDALIELYIRYENMKSIECVIDGDDLLFLLVRLLREQPEVLEKYRKIYKYVLIDEAQDNNSVQYELIRLLGAPEFNLFLVGDDDQSMYGFRNAKPIEFINFNRTYKNVKQVFLEINYRSDPKILEVANNLIANNKVRLDKKLKSGRDVNEEECVFYAHYETEDDEGTGIAESISEIVKNDCRDYGDIAVLYRVNAQSRALEDALIMSGIPYEVHGGISFYERREVKDILAYLRLAANPNDDMSFLRVINVPSRYLGKAFIGKVENQGGSHYNTIQRIKGLKAYEQKGCRNFMVLVESLRSLANSEVPPVELVDFIMDFGGYENYILEDGDEEDEGTSRMENIETLIYVISKYTSLEEFLEYVDKMTSPSVEGSSRVQLMTIHKAKGLEFPTVFVVGLSEGVLPHHRAISANKNGDPSAVEEERRMAYVAVTRAESSLYLTSVGNFNNRPGRVSRFIREMGVTSDEDKKEDATDI